MCGWLPPVAGPVSAVTALNAPEAGALPANAVPAPLPPEAVPHETMAHRAITIGTVCFNALIINFCINQIISKSSIPSQMGIFAGEYSKYSCNFGSVVMHQKPRHSL
jgi:hypothetical protein